MLTKLIRQILVLVTLGLTQGNVLHRAIEILVSEILRSNHLFVDACCCRNCKPNPSLIRTKKSKFPKQLGDPTPYTSKPELPHNISIPVIQG